MTTIYLIALFSLLILVLILLLKFKPELLKKYWKYLAGAGAVAFSVVFLAGKLKKTKKLDVKGDNKKKKLDEDIERVNEEAETEIAEAKKEEKEVTDKLEKIKEISDEEERLKQLSELFNKTRR